MTKYVVALDLGTSSCRAAALTGANIKCLKNCSLVPTRHINGTSEYSAQDILHVACDVLHQVLDEVGPANVIALAISSQRSTVVLWDRISGKACAPVLTWEDGRAVHETTEAQISQERVHCVTGLYKVPYFSAPKIAWAIHHVSTVQAVMHQGKLVAAPVASFLISHLTQGRTIATDPTLAQRMLLFDIHQGIWSRELCDAFSIPLDILPELKSTVDDYGVYTYKGCSIPIRVCVGDQQAACALLKEGQMHINYGTGAFVLCHTGARSVISPGLLTSVAPSYRNKPLNYLLEGPVNAAGSAYVWLKTKGIEIDMSRLDEICRKAKSPLQILPAVGGLGAPYWNYNLSPVVKGISSRTIPSDWAAGLTRSIAFLIADIVAYMRAMKVEPAQSIQVAGGLSKSDYLLQFEADILQCTLARCVETEKTLTGLAYLTSHNISPYLPTEFFHPSIPSIEAEELYQAWQRFLRDCMKSVAEHFSNG